MWPIESILEQDQRTYKKRKEKKKLRNEKDTYSRKNTEIACAILQCDCFPNPVSPAFSANQGLLHQIESKGIQKNKKNKIKTNFKYTNFSVAQETKGKEEEKDRNEPINSSTKQNYLLLDSLYLLSSYALDPRLLRCLLCGGDLDLSSMTTTSSSLLSSSLCTILGPGTGTP